MSPCVRSHSMVERFNDFGTPVHWKHKAAIQSLIGWLPAGLGNPVYYQLQRRLGGLRHPEPIRRLRAGIELVRRLEQLERSVESAVFLEVGTGHQLAMPLSLWLCGAGEITTVDLNRYLKESLVLGDIEYLRRHEVEVRELFGTIAQTRRFNERFELLCSGRNSLADLLSLTGIQYRAPADAGCLPLGPNSIDFHVSYTVLEHIPPEVLRRIFREGRRLLRPGGLFVHCIDFSDHFAHSDDSISSVNFLQYSDGEWDGLAGNRYMYHNRLRVDEFEELLRGEGLRIHSLDTRVDAGAVALLRNGFPLNERFRGKDPRTNAIRDAWVAASPGRDGARGEGMQTNQGAPGHTQNHDSRILQR